MDYAFGKLCGLAGMPRDEIIQVTKRMIRADSLAMARAVQDGLAGVGLDLDVVEFLKANIDT